MDYTILFNLIYILAGLLLLIKGGDWLVLGSVAVARRLKLSTMVIGLTIVAFGTSAPELLVSIQAALQGSSAIALGNVVGSNIANIALILGATAVLAVVPVKKMTLIIDMPFLLTASILLLLASFSGTITRWQGIVGILMLFAFVGWQVRASRKHPDAADAEIEQVKPMAIWKACGLIVISCAALAFGADWLVDGASGIARTIGSHYGIDSETMERMIGLTIVAIGTSLPELFASVMAAKKGETDMAIGNVIGSNIFNILCVLGCTAAITPIPHANEGFTTDYIWMICLTTLLWLFLRTGFKLSRTEGIVLLGIYVYFLAQTIIQAHL